MQRRTAFLAIAALICLPVDVWATLIVNPPPPITHRVSVQVIQTTKTDGTSPATLFGTPTQESNIKSRIDQIWAQAGIDIEFLPTVNVFNNTFAYQGSVTPPTPRPDGDLNSIISLAGTAGKLNTTPSVLNVFFVEIVPHFTQLPEDTAAGFAKIGDDGIAFTVGSTLPTFQNGRDVVASVLAHEIGHNLGLNHVNDVTNLMNSGVNPQVEQRLTAAQISDALETTDSPQLLPALLGDYNGNDEVDAADYTVWRDALTAGATSLANDPTPGTVDESDFIYWRTHFGESLGSSEGAGTAAAVPEPATLTMLLMASLVMLSYRARQFRQLVPSRHMPRIDRYETSIRRVVEDVARAIRHPFSGTLPDAP